MNKGKSELAKWMAEIGVTNARMPRAGIQTALAYFDRYVPELPRPLRIAFLKGMDLSKVVRVLTLFPPFPLAAFRQCNEDPLNLYYTKAQAGIDRLGVNPLALTFRQYRVASLVSVLESSCAPAPEIWTDDRRYYFAGLGVQYIIPTAFRYIELVR